MFQRIFLTQSFFPSRHPSKGVWEPSCDYMIRRGRSSEERLIYLSSTLVASGQSFSFSVFTTPLSDINKATVFQKSKGLITILPFSLLSGFLRVLYSLFLQIKGDNIRKAASKALSFLFFT